MFLNNVFGRWSILSTSTKIDFNHHEPAWTIMKIPADLFSSAGRGVSLEECKWARTKVLHSDPVKNEACINTGFLHCDSLSLIRQRLWLKTFVESQFGIMRPITLITFLCVVLSLQLLVPLLAAFGSWSLFAASSFLLILPHSLGKSPLHKHKPTLLSQDGRHTL